MTRRRPTETLTALIALAEKILADPDRAFRFVLPAATLHNDVIGHLRPGGYVNFTTAALCACLYVVVDLSVPLPRRQAAARGARELLVYVRADLNEALAARAALTGDGA